MKEAWLQHAYNNPLPDDGVHPVVAFTLPSDWNNKHPLSHPPADADPADGVLLTWYSASSSRVAFRTLTGTANQVAIAIADEAITLSLPQDIATGSSPQFLALGLNIGVGAAGTLKTSGTATIGGNLVVSGVGPHVVGGATSTRFQFLLTGSYVGSGGAVGALVINGTVTGPSGQDVYGAWVSQALTITGAPSQTAALRVDAPIGSQAGAVSSATVLIPNAPSGATNNYSLWIQDGLSQFSRTTAPAILIQPSGVASAEVWMRHGSLVNNSKFISDISANLDIQTNNVLAIRISSAQSVTFNAVGPHAIGGGLNVATQLQIGGTWAGAGQAELMRLNTTLTGVASANSFGVIVVPTFVEAASGTHGQMSAVYVAPAFTNGAGSTTSVFGINIDTMSTGAMAPANATGLRIAVPTGGTINRSMHIQSGLSQFDGIVAVSSGGGVVNTTNIGLEFRGSTTPSITWYDRTAVGYLPANYDALRHLISFSGAAGNDGVGLYLSGTFASAQSFARGMQMDMTLTAASNGGNLVGIYLNPVLTERSGGTHALLAGMYIQPSVTAGVATTTTAAGIYIDAITWASGTTEASGLTINVGSGATTNYAILANSGSVKFASAGPHAIGGGIDATRAVLLTGSFTSSAVAEGLRMLTTLTMAAGVSAFGMTITPTFVEAASGTHPLFATLYVAPTITAGAGNVTSLAGVYADTFTAQATTTTASCIVSPSAPTGATNNYSLFIGGRSRFDAGVDLFMTSPTYGAAVVIDAALSDTFRIVATNNTAFTINSPTNTPVSAGKRLVIMIKNTSGGALGAITAGATYKLFGGAFTSPATATSRSHEFEWDGTNWIELWRGANDIPN